MKIISRAEAKQQGLKRYFTGKPCKRGHVCERYVNDCQCYQCGYDKCRARYLADPQSDSDRVMKWKSRNPEKARATWLRWSRLNPQKNRARAARYRAKKLQRVPPWADLKAIDEFYENCPSNLTVDHYYPLNGEIVSGLHVVENLQYLSLKDNSSKRNKMPEDFYE